jgi:hypothetical protein
LGFSFCINCNLYWYNCKCFSTGCRHRFHRGSEWNFHKLSSACSVMLGLFAWLFPWWQMQPLSRNCSYHLRTDDTGGPRYLNFHENMRWATNAVISHKFKHTPPTAFCWKGSRFVKQSCMLFPQDSFNVSKAIPM